MEYEEVESYLLEIPKFTKKNTVEDTRAFLHALGDPGKEKTVIHIAGTNGKGSVCAYLASVLQKAGYRTGMFTSPHLVTMRERFRIDGRLIGEKDFTDCFEKVKRCMAGGIPGKEAYHPTFFEMLFFMAMVYFEKENAEVILLETGLGGRLDATNSVSRKALCILTEIGLDHMEYLGDSIPEIAEEKAGILQKGVPLVYMEMREEASRVIKKKAETLSCPVFSVSKNDIRNLEFHKNFIDFSYNTRYYGYVRCTLASNALYQAENAALALCALDVLAEKLPVSETALTEGMKEARWEGRMEEVLPDVYVDGAHNMDGIRAFLDTVTQDGCCGRRFLLFSAVQDKQYREMIGLLAGPGIFDRIYLTEIRNIRGLSRQALEAAFASAGAKAIDSFPEAGPALETLCREKRPEDRVYIAGSLYLAGEIKSYIKRNGYDQF